MTAIGSLHQLTEYDTPASLSGEDTLLPSIPMFHLLAWGSPVIAPYLGADLLMTGQYDPETVGSLVEDGEATWTNMVPTMARQLLETDHSLDGLKVLTGDSTIQRDLVSQFREHDIEFSTIYGGTDMLAASISIWSDEARNEGGYEYLRRVTHPVPFGEFQLVHQEGMEDDMGEIQFRAPWLPDGYYKLPEKTADAFVDGWFNTALFCRLVTTVWDALTVIFRQINPEMDAVWRYGIAQTACLDVSRSCQTAC
ncbi:AMP-binding protein [Halorubrum kocurii]|uniref:Acyl-CoA synthetase (AMP-forming)/AMP-acid ligase II n=1 Tax=Halorubrum kocurii JCM 14978 TaxID=1230456 RepID=M0PHY1_9EURY|nr:AMP-binding protein [Halorubrum kocurii]EMA69219.1 acyl-CoA synthetase (AMP-forming)/AMP-acid ligase II [Halorubrum kocurii JCM 14978]